MPRTIIDDIVILKNKEVTSFAFCQYTSIRFFEILFFEKGNGTIIINGNKIQYKANTIFLLIPDDIYTITSTTPTTVTAIKFLKSFFNNTQTHNHLPVNSWFRNIEGVLCTQNHQHRTLTFNSKAEKQNLIALINVLSEEFLNNKTNDLLIIKNSLSIILQMIARNIRVIISEKKISPQTSKIQDIINYIHNHIYEPELLTNKAIASTFHISENYLNQYFKKNMDMSIKKYKLNYKLKLIENRLKYTDLQFSEIASEFGFTDTSHLNKTFLAYKGQTLRAFKASLN